MKATAMKATAMNATVLARTAERVYWLGRYLERADATARLMAVNAHLIMDLPMKLPLGWRPLIDITGSAPLFDSLHGPDAQATERNVCHFLATEKRNPGSLLNCIDRVRDNARHVRETMPRTTFEYINELSDFARSHLAAGQSRSSRAEALAGISRRTQQLEGFLSQNMLHDAHWDILRLGNYIERADMTTRIIDVRTADLFAGSHDLEPFQHIQWCSVLRSFSAMQAYHASVREAVEPALVLEFLFRDARLPRSYLRCLHGIARALNGLPRSERADAARREAVRALEAADVKALGGPESRAALHGFIDRCQIRLGTLHAALAATYFD